MTAVWWAFVAVCVFIVAAVCVTSCLIVLCALIGQKRCPEASDLEQPPHTRHLAAVPDDWTARYLHPTNRRNRP